MSKLAERVGDLKVKTTRFVFMDAPTKRKFKKALEQGLSREAALVAAGADSGEGGNAKTTKVSTTISKPLYKGPKPTYGRPKPTYSQARSCTKLGITSVDPDNKPLSSEDLVTIKKAILKEVRDNEDVERHPEFETTTTKAGWMTITCSNEETVEWLKAKFSNVQATCGLDISLVDKDKRPRTYFVNGYFGSSANETNEGILAYIASQNRKLPAKSWNVISRTKEGQMDHLVFGMDVGSWQALNLVGGKMPTSLATCG